jgi:hypothetical protein
MLLTKEDTGMVWFHGRKQEIEDATPERTTTRTLTETTGFKASDTNLRHLARNGFFRTEIWLPVYRSRSTRIDSERCVISSGIMGYLEGFNFGAAYGLPDSWR